MPPIAIIIEFPVNLNSIQTMACEFFVWIDSNKCGLWGDQCKINHGVVIICYVSSEYVYMWNWPDAKFINFTETPTNI